MRPALRLALVGFALFWLANPVAHAMQAPKLVAETEARTPTEERAGFHLPEGFAIELVASEPEINKPMNLAFDARGRLWVTSTVEYPYPAKEGTRPRDRVVILGDFADDGKARKVETFADGLNIPIGIMPLGQGESALVHDIPHIRRFVDTDGDGKADKIEPAYEKYGFRDTHGMTNAFTWGFDGWIYACHGFSNESTVKGSDGKPIVMQSGNVYRMRPDGSHAEYVTHGQVNPFGLAFDPLGNLYSCDCHSRPLYQLIRGAYYPSFGKPDDGLGFGPEMIGHDHGSTGIGGIVYYAADHFPEAYRGTTFIGNVVTSRINHDRLAWTGTTPKAIEQPDFVVSDDPWFRPVDLELGPDGALYVADFYNRIIGHYEVPLTHPGRDRERGRIWRIVYKGKDGKGLPPKPPRPDQSAATIAELLQDLAHPNLVVRMTATNLLVLRGAESVGPLKGILERAQGFQKIHVLWALQRLGALDDGTLRRASKDPDEAVRVHVLKIVAERPELSVEARHLSRQSDVALLGQADRSPRVHRAMAEAMSRRPTLTNIHCLLLETFHANPADTHLKHTVKVALRDQLLDSEAWEYVTSRKFSDLEESYIAEVALGVPMTESARFLLHYLEREAAPVPADPPKSAPPLSLEQQARYARHVARFGGADAEAGLVKFARLDKFGPGRRVVLLKAIQQGTQERGGKLGPEARGLAAEVARTLLASANGGEIQAGIELAGSMKLEGVKDTLARVAEARDGPVARRNSAMTALVALDPTGSIGALDRIVRDSGEPVEVREGSANLLVGLGKPETRAILVDAMSTAPARLQTAIAVGLSQNRQGAEALLAAVAAGKASARPLQERGVAVRLESSGVPEIRKRLETLLKDLPPADRRVQSLIEARRDGFLGFQAVDRDRGIGVFEKNCASCHQLEGKGARVGPQLDGVGLRGLERLLEDTLDPNRNVDQAFRVTTLALNDGRIAAGLLLRQDGEILVLADAQGKDVRVPASAVEDRKLSQLSPMPANMAEQIEEADFYQLIAYLLSCRPVK